MTKKAELIDRGKRCDMADEEDVDVSLELNEVIGNLQVLNALFAFWPSMTVDFEDISSGVSWIIQRSLTQLCEVGERLYPPLESTP